jgi:hypothetical protein
MRLLGTKRLRLANHLRSLAAGKTMSMVGRSRRRFSSATSWMGAVHARPDQRHDAHCGDLHTRLDGCTDLRVFRPERWSAFPGAYGAYSGAVYRYSASGTHTSFIEYLNINR